MMNANSHFGTLRCSLIAYTILFKVHSLYSEQVETDLCAACHTSLACVVEAKRLCDLGD